MTARASVVCRASEMIPLVQHPLGQGAPPPGVRQSPQERIVQSGWRGRSLIV